MNLWFAFVVGLIIPHAAFAQAQADPSTDPVRGDAIEAALRKGDAATLKTLLRPADRDKYATYSTTASVKQGRNWHISNLLNETALKSDNSCLIALLEYGIGMEAAKLAEFDDLLVFKNHYPDFLITLGRDGVTYAAQSGNNELLVKLLNMGISAQPADLAAAVSFSHAGAVKLLLAAGVPKDSSTQHEGKKMTMVEIARKGMFFAVLDELGAWDSCSAELKSYREGRPGQGAAKLVGIWKVSSLYFRLEPDGSGFIGDGQERGLPILWKTLKQDGHEGLRIDPVPGYAPPNGHTFDTMWAQSAGEKISYQGHKGLVEWTRVGMNSDQRQAYLAASQPVKYAGPVGVWTVQFDACKFPPGMSAEQQNQAKGWNLNIAADGNCSMTFSGETVRLHAIKGDNNELKLVPENRPPFICNGSDEWKTIRLNLPPSFTLVFVKDAK